MKAGWDVKPLGDLLSVLKNGINCKQDKSGNGVKISRIESISDATFNSERVGYADLSEAEKQRYCLKKGDILFSHINSPIHVGKTAIFDCDEPIYHGVNILLMRPTEKLLPEYLNFALKYLFQTGYWARTSKQSVNQASVNQKDISCVDISYPTSKEEQHRIVAILDEAFEVIATARANAEQNRQNARALFESYLQSVFSQHGNGWVGKSFSEVCKISSTLVDPRQDEYLEQLHIGGANIEAKTGKLLELRTAREENLISGKFIFDESMVLYSKIRPYLMKVVRPDFKGLCSADIYPLSPKSGVLDRNYLFHMLLSPQFTEYANTGSARAGMPKVNRGHLFSYRCFFPPIEQQIEFAASLDALHEETQCLESLYQRKIAALDELKQSLLQQAFSGKL